MWWLKTVRFWLEQISNRNRLIYLWCTTLSFIIKIGELKIKEERVTGIWDKSRLANGLFYCNEVHSWILTFGGLHNELVEGEALTTSSGDASTGSLSESKSGNSQLGDSEDSLVIGDGGNNNDGLALIRLLLVMLDELRERKRRSVHSGGDKSSQDGLVEVRSGSSREESEEL